MYVHFLRAWHANYYCCWNSGLQLSNVLRYFLQIFLQWSFDNAILQSTLGLRFMFLLRCNVDTLAYNVFYLHVFVSGSCIRGCFNTGPCCNSLTPAAGIFDVDSTLNRRRIFDGRRKSVEKRKNISKKRWTFDSRWNFDVDSTSNRRRYFNGFLFGVENTLKRRWKFDVEICPLGVAFL